MEKYFSILSARPDLAATSANLTGKDKFRLCLTRSIFAALTESGSGLCDSLARLFTNVMEIPRTNETGQNPARTESPAAPSVNVRPKARRRKAPRKRLRARILIPKNLPPTQIEIEVIASLLDDCESMFPIVAEAAE